MLSPTKPSNTRKRCPFHHRGLECQSRKSRDPWSNRQVWPWTTKWSRSRLTKLCQENALVIPNTLFHNTRDDSTHGHHQMVNTGIRLIIFFAAKDGGDGIPAELFQILKDDGVKVPALNMPANLENSAMATGMEKVSFHSNPKERQCQRMFKLLHICTHLTH